MASSVPPYPGALPFTHEEYRSVPVAQAITNWNFESVWALLVDGNPDSPLPGAEDFPLAIHTGDQRVDMQSALAGLAPVWGFTSLSTTTPATARTSLARASVTALSFVAQSARGADVPAVPAWIVDQVNGSARRFLTRWQGEADESFVRAIDAAWIAIAANPDCPSVRVAIRTAATGADVAACLSAAVAAASGSLVSGGAGRLAQLLRQPASAAATEELAMEWGLIPTSPSPPSARVLALEEVASSLGNNFERSRAHAQLLGNFTHPLAPSDLLLTLMWVTHLFMTSGVHDRMLTAMFACGKTAGWSAAIAVEHSRLLEKINQ